MNDQFDELTKGLAQSVTRRGVLNEFGLGLAGLALATLFALPMHANDLRLGPILNLSDPDVFAACGSNGSEKESSIRVNPTNPKNLVVAWIGGLGKGIGCATSFDGGKRWQQVLIPGISVCNGGTQDFDTDSDPWLSFSPNGILHHVCVANSDSGLNAILASRSADGGLNWSAPVRVLETTDKRFFGDKPSITADPVRAELVYAIWSNDANGNRGGIAFSRTTDGGSTWEPARLIYNPDTADAGTTGNIINVLPDGALVDVFTEFKYSDGGTHNGALLSVIRSTDKGQSWSTPVRVRAIPVFTVTDPDTGGAVVGSSIEFPNPAVATDPNNGNLYITWEETAFSEDQYSSIAFAMSTNGGFTWSAPIRVNQTPANIATANRQAFIPGIAVAADGTIGVTYYDFRFNDPNPGLPTDYWLVHCHPSARTPVTNPANWGNEVRLTAQSFDVETAPHRPGDAHYFLGDYEGLATVGNDFLAAWSYPHATDLNSVFFRRIGP